jgi:hypothetical protein
MKQAWIWRVLAALGFAALAVWFVMNTRWVEEEEPLPPKGAALADPYYALRKIVAATGTTLEIRHTLDPLPPRDATLVLDTGSWDLFPERDARLKAWVEAGGHLVVVGPVVLTARSGQLRWIPLSFVPAPRKPAAVASAPRRAEGEDDDDDEDDADTTPRSPASPASAAPGTRAATPPLIPGVAALERRHCEVFEEIEGATPAFDAGRRFLGCLYPFDLRPLHARPTWGLANEKNTLALRVPLGRGDVTALSAWLPVESRPLLAGDNALILAAAFDLPSRRPLWLVESEEREPLPAWIWHNARAPLMLALAAIALALWRLMVRFGPREATLAQARRSMGEQLRGTGEFIAARDPQALHAATREALDEAARSRIEGYAGLDDVARVDALARVARLDKTALREALRPAAAPHQILAAIATLEQARRALLHAAVPPRS